MYVIPLRYIKVSPIVGICATRITAIMSTESLQCRKLLSDEKKNKTLINASRNLKTKSAIILDNGSVIASPYTVDKIIKIIDDANHKDAEYIKHRTKKAQTLVYESNIQPIEDVSTDEEEEYEDEDEGIDIEEE